jgi:probable O-glycosylation ligase (exosortase A-associated)
MLRDIVFMSAYVALIAAILYRPWLGIIAWTVLGLVQVQLLTWSLQDFSFAMWVAVATLLGMVLTKDRRGVPFAMPTVLLGLLAVWFTITTLQAWTPDPAWEQWKKVMKIFLMTFVMMILIHDKVRVRALLLVIPCAIGLYGAKGGIFAIASGGSQMVMGPGEGSYIGGNNNFGLALAMILPLLLVVAREQKRIWMKNGFLAVFWLSAAAAVFTYSRGALLGLGVVLSLLFLGVRRKALVLMLVIPALLIALSLVPEKLIDRARTIETYEMDQSAMGRIQAWGVAWNIASSHGLGSGFGLDFIDIPTWNSYTNFVIDWSPRVVSAHSIYFQVLGEHGFIGLILFLLLVASTLRTFGQVKRIARKSEELRWMYDWAVALQIGLAGYLVAGAFLSLAYFDLFYSFAAIAVIMHRECRGPIGNRVALAPVARPA